MRHGKVILALAVALGTIAVPASASLIFSGTVADTGQGFGTAPRALTIHANDSESGCVGFVAGAFTVGPTACPAGDATIDPNGTTNSGGQEENPTNDNQKFGAPTIGSLGITSASGIGILFNAAEDNQGPITLNDLTLGFYSAGGVLLQSVDNGAPQVFLNTDPGNGNAGFVFTIDSAEQQTLDNLIFGTQGFGNLLLALQSTLTGSGGGPESFLIFNTGVNRCVGLNCGPQPDVVPEPASLALLGIGLVGLAASRRVRKVR